MLMPPIEMKSIISKHLRISLEIKAVENTPLVRSNKPFKSIYGYVDRVR